jgi:hypothetical protein
MTQAHSSSAPQSAMIQTRTRAATAFIRLEWASAEMPIRMETFP